MGEDGIGVHNDNCFYEYIPHISREQEIEVLSWLKIKAQRGLPDYVCWAPTWGNITELFLRPEQGGLFAHP